MAITKIWKVYGAEGHRQRMSFGESVKYDWTGCNEYIKGTRIFEAINADKTGTNDYTIIKITRDTVEECEATLEGQISDGYFENSRTGKVVEITEEECISILEEKIRKDKFRNMNDAFKRIINDLDIELIKYGTKGYYYMILADEDDWDTALGCVNDIDDVRRIEKEMIKLGYEIFGSYIEIF